MYGGCETCKHSWGEENCKGCLWDGKSITTTHWEPKEPKEPFINKPCVSGQACHDDKMKVLEKIRERIKLEKLGYPPSSGYYKAIIKCLQIIDKYMAESEDKE